MDVRDRKPRIIGNQISLRNAALGLILAGALGCTAEDGTSAPDLLRDDIPAPPAGGLQVATPIFDIPAGEEVFMCMRMPVEITETVYVQRSNVYQSENGHHTLVFYSENDTGVDPEPHRCDGFDMTDVRIVTTGAANGTGLAMPEGVAMTIPAGASLWVQSHYINASDQPRRVQDVVNLTLLPEAEVVDIASTFAHVDTSFILPPGQTTTREMECEVQQAMTVPWLLPHMHEWGNYFEAEITRGDEQLWAYEGEWYTNLRNDFPIQDLDEYLQLEPGDKLRTSCTWNNTEAMPMGFPQEMCVTFFPFYPGDGTLLVCDESGTQFRP